ncbi:hypothetical protein KL935_000717 [Ogataea polymorpha]|nr:hypothetical protein KL937_002808 [Ogataea polymorpha]KAG7897010.1 hypothetical protein KL908_000412 [Ogataea polymorpha]KAG7903185.1 hypothetical protein KL935_000717 [Ogataea polymorpha]KAG7913219.1 hypothetical protein KL907_000164 [Ogataea polymorpha]KAG7937807.1 hypothetical protein KL904_001954 [Ogataea polymorpha]
MVSDNYGIVVDSGSSGSRIQIYKWKDPAGLQNESKDPAILSSVPQIVQEDKWTYKIDKGLSTFADHPEDVWEDHFEPLIKYAEQIVPEDKLASTPIFVQATAGMRLVPEEQREKVLKSVCKALKEETHFQIDRCDDHVQVIDGETEGIYGWIGLNYLKGKLNQYDPKVPISDHDSYGFMDMGGASTQIAFVPSNAVELEQHKDDLYEVSLRNVNGEIQRWPVFVSTWLGFGANEARKRHLKNLITTLPDGVNYDKDGDSTYDIYDPCSPKNMHIKQELNGITYEITGLGDYKTCMKHVYPLLLKHLPCKEDPCLFNGVHAPTIDFEKDKFIGVSEYWYTANDVFHMGGAYNFKKFEERLKEFCEQDWEQIELNFKNKQYGSNIPEAILKDSCFKASWVVNVLHEGFGLPRIGFETGDLSEEEVEKLNKQDTEHIPFQSANQIDGADLSWTLGKIILYASSQVPSNDGVPVGVLPGESAQTAIASAVKPTPSVAATDSLNGYFAMMVGVLLLAFLGYGFFTKKFTHSKFLSRKGLNGVQASSIRKFQQQCSNKISSKLKSFRHAYMVPDEEATMYEDQFTPKLPQRASSASVPQNANFNTLRTRSTLNLSDFQSDIPQFARSTSANSLPGKIGSSAQLDKQGLHFDFMSKKYNKYVNRSISPNRGVSFPQALGLSSGSQVELKTSNKSKASD